MAVNDEIEVMVVFTVVVAVLIAKKRRNGDWRGAANPGCTTNGTNSGGVFSGPSIGSGTLSSLWVKIQHLNSSLYGKCGKAVYFGNGRKMLSISSSNSSDRDLLPDITGAAAGAAVGAGVTLATQTFNAAVEVVQMVVLVNVEVKVEVPTVIIGLKNNCRLLKGATTSGIPLRNPTLGFRK